MIKVTKMTSRDSDISKEYNHFINEIYPLLRFSSARNNGLIYGWYDVNELVRRYI